jgi:hypothetical protein
MNSRLESIPERMLAAVRRFFGRPAQPSSIMQRKQKALAVAQAEGSRAVQKRDDGRWENEGGSATNSAGAVPSPLDKP